MRSRRGHAADGQEEKEATPAGDQVRSRLALYLNGLNDCGVESFGSRGVSISSRRSPARRMNVKPNRGSASICQSSAARRSIAAVIAPYRSLAGSKRSDSITCHYGPNTAIQRGVLVFS